MRNATTDMDGNRSFGQRVWYVFHLGAGNLSKKENPGVKIPGFFSIQD